MESQRLIQNRRIDLLASQKTPMNFIKADWVSLAAEERKFQLRRFHAKC